MLSLKGFGDTDKPVALIEDSSLSPVVTNEIVKFLSLISKKILLEQAILIRHNVRFAVTVGTVMFKEPVLATPVASTENVFAWLVEM